MKSVQTPTAAAAATASLGADLATRLEAGDVVLVTGDLGAGKTTFVRGACEALGVEEPVVSPTFTIGRRYTTAAGVDVSHLDLYRLESFGDEDPALLDDYLTEDAIAFVEWPAVAASELPRIAARVAIEHAGGDGRVVTVEEFR